MKPGTFTQIYIQLIFSPLYREALLHPPIRPEIFSYMSGIVTHLGHKSIIINGMADHVHLFINQQKFFPGKFQWQSGYGGFSYSQSHIERVYQYILNQQEHHKKKSFREEYMGFLKKYNIEFENQYLFEFFHE
jgi:putative transposase